MKEILAESGIDISGTPASEAKFFVACELDKSAIKRTNMKTFFQWTEANGLLSDIVADAEPSKKTIDEKKMRTGMTVNYPPLYSRDQYSQLAQMAIKSTCALDFQQKPATKYGGQRAAN